MPRWHSVFCRAPNCSVRMPDVDTYYCEAHFGDFHDALVATVGILAGEGCKFYLGRTNWAERRLLSHRAKLGLNRLAVIHWASDQGEIEEIESYLIDACRELPECLNKTSEPEGKWHGDWYCIYVAWEQGDGAEIPEFANAQDVRVLDAGNRLCPDRSRLPMTPVVFRTALTKKAAREEAEPWTRS